METTATEITQAPESPIYAPEQSTEVPASSLGRQFPSPLCLQCEEWTDDPHSICAECRKKGYFNALTERPNCLTIAGRTFDVTLSPKPDGDGLPMYILTGKRGASYFTMRNKPNPDILFLVNARRFGMAPGPMADVRLTDAGGTLREVR